MKRTALTLISLLILTITAQAQLLWKIEGKDAARPSYIFGTHHLAPISVLDSVPTLRDVITNADVICGEVVMADMMKPEGAMKIAQSFIAPPDSTLSKVFTPAQLDTINTVLNKFMPGASAQMFEAYMPSMLSMTMASLLGQLAFPDTDLSKQLDATIQETATQAGKPVQGLETVDDQIKILTGSPISDQANALMKTIGDLDKAIEQSHRLAADYRAGDLDALLDEMNSEADSEADMDRLLYDRNRNWAALIPTQLPTASYLYVVGAGHLPGEKGLINLLRKAGYTLTPVQK